jgi:hypothetical protein
MITWSRIEKPAATLIRDGTAKSCFHTQDSLSRRVIGSVGLPDGRSKQIADYFADQDGQPDGRETCRSSNTVPLTSGFATGRL